MNCQISALQECFSKLKEFGEKNKCKASFVDFDMAHLSSLARSVVKLLTETDEATVPFKLEALLVCGMTDETDWSATWTKILRLALKNMDAAMVDSQGDAKAEDPSKCIPALSELQLEVKPRHRHLLESEKVKQEAAQVQDQCLGFAVKFVASGCRT